MITCRNCGQLNDDAVHVCRYCGTNLSTQPRPTQQQQQQYTPPPPYAWAQSGPLAPAPATQQQQYAAPPTSAGYRCPRCGAAYLPTVEKRVSSEGWLILVLMIFFCFPLFWIGLLMKQEYRVCPVCHANLG